MKKYVNFIIGLIVIFTFINPFINFMNLNLNLDKKVFSYGEIDLENYENISKKQEDLVEKLYFKKIENEVKNIIEEENDYFVVNVNTFIEKDPENYGKINYLEIVLDLDKKNIKNKKIEIKKVNIEQEINKHKYNNKEEYKNIREIISDKLGIDKESIYISLKDEEMK